MSETMILVSAILAAELLLTSLVLLGFTWFRNLAKQRRDEQAMRVLVTRVKNSKTERETSIRRFLGEQMELSGESLDQVKTAMLRAELVLLQRFARVYAKRDAAAAAQFDIDFIAALAPYHQLQGAGGIVVDAEPPAADASELQDLRSANQRLSDELSVTMETMSRMLNEYSTMFAGGAPGQAVPVAAVLGGGSTDTSAMDGDAASGALPEPAPPLDAETSFETAAPDLPVDAEASPDPDVAAVQNSGDIEIAAAGEVEVPFAASDDDTISDLSADEGAIHDTSDEGGEPIGAVDSGDQPPGAEAVDHADVEIDVAAEVETVVELAEAEIGVEVEEPAAGTGTEAVCEEDASFDEALAGNGAVEMTEDVERVGDLLEHTAPDVVADVSQEKGDGATKLEQSGLAGDQPEGTGGVDKDAGDNAEAVAEPLPEGSAEVVSLDEPDGFDIEPATGEGQSPDPEESDIIVRSEEAAWDLPDNAGVEEAIDVDALFDSVEQPLKKHSGH